MSILSWFLKPKRNMAKPNTRMVRIGKYRITPHAQNRLIERDRYTPKWDMVDNLFTRPHALSHIKYDSRGRPSYNRIGKRITTSINPFNHNVVSVRPVSKPEIKRYNLQKKGRYYVKNRK